ncbi:MAG: transcriptional regulator NrdR [Gammaproteobacteria bacterium]|nr:transcriptional regulator NrdR [Gammaproteobacteria bacterium]
MHCPFCQAIETKVIDSRMAEDGAQVRRRRECLQCLERFTTYETIELTLPRVIKNDGTHSAFNLDKLRTGITKALEKRPISMEQIDQALNHIIHILRASGEREVASKYIGELVMAELRKLDQVAYVRFASVYRSFQDINAFREEIQRLQEQE